MTPDPHGLINENTPPDLLLPVWSGDELGIAGALFNVQTDLPNIPKKGKGKKTWTDKRGVQQEFKYDYIKLEDLMPVVKQLFQKHRIVILQAPYSCLKDGNLYAMTFFKHVDTGGSVRFAYPACSLKDRNGQQDIAAAFTPAKRHAIIAGLAIAGEDDKDGQGTKATVGGQDNPEPQPEPKKGYKAVEKAVAPEPTAAAQKKIDKDTGTRLWNLSLSNDLSLEETLVGLKEAEGITNKATKDPVVKALTIREICYKADTEAQIEAARKALSEIPETLRGLKTKGVPANDIFKGFIDEAESLLDVNVKAARGQQP